MILTPTPVLVWLALCVCTLVGVHARGFFHALMEKRRELTCLV